MCPSFHPPTLGAPDSRTYRAGLGIGPIEGEKKERRRRGISMKKEEKRKTVKAKVEREE